MWPNFPPPLTDAGRSQAQQYPGIRGQPAAVEPDMPRLARNRWPTRQNPRTFIHGGGELRCFRLIRLKQPNHTRNQWLVSLPPAPSRRSMNFQASGLTRSLESSEISIALTHSVESQKPEYATLGPCFRSCMIV